MRTTHVQADARANEHAEEFATDHCSHEESMRLYDVHSRFAHVHLSTRAERAVYFTLVAQLAESWSAEEIASLKDLDVGTVEAVLDRYADAGVVGVVDSTTGLRYRWCSDMSYLFGAGSSAVTMIDPVCGMTIAGGTPHWLQDGPGTFWLFCSSICLATFRANPQTRRSAPQARRDEEAVMRSASGRPWNGPTTCKRQYDVAAFLLGALTLPEERELMTHTAACQSCHAALHELGNLPDLLALVPRSVAELINRSANRP